LPDTIVTGISISSRSSHTPLVRPVTTMEPDRGSCVLVRLGWPSAVASTVRDSFVTGAEGKTPMEKKPPHDRQDREMIEAHGRAGSAKDG
jgi:hypothetical protein